MRLINFEHFLFNCHWDVDRSDFRQLLGTSDDGRRKDDNASNTGLNVHSDKTQIPAFGEIGDQSLGP